MRIPRPLSASILTASIVALLLVPGAVFGLAAPLGPEIRVATARSEFDPLTAIFPDGGFVVAWTQGGGTPVIHARLYAASGAPTSAELRLGQPAAQLVLDGVAVTTDGAFVIVWEQARPKNHVLMNVFARKFDRRAKPLTSAFVVHEASPYSRYNGAVAGTADGGFVVAWAADNPPSPQFGIRSADAIARFFRANGTAAGPALRLTGGDIIDPVVDYGILPAAVAVAPDGSVMIVSNCVCDQPGLVLQRFRSDGVVLDDIDPASGCTCRGDLTIFPSLSMAPDGSFVVAWVNGVGLHSTNPDDSFPTVVRARRFAADGSALGDVFQVNQGGRLAVTPHVAMLADGGFVIGWTDQTGRDGNRSGVFVRAYDADGGTSGPDLQLNLRTAGDQILSSIVAAGDHAVAVWLDAGTRVEARLLMQP
ncbi:MAG TPA: hypothetical protein VLV54_01420 [Thermoanaerobaculia bacterium]|nr:hypothetical protein [Thermoanaerobaculia bacterium]